MFANVHERRTLKCDITTGLIVGGVEAKPNEFPHMGALAYPDGFNDELVFGCGAFLISERFLISAAHCKHHG